MCVRVCMCVCQCRWVVWVLYTESEGDGAVCMSAVSVLWGWGVVEGRESRRGCVCVCVCVLSGMVKEVWAYIRSSYQTTEYGWINLHSNKYTHVGGLRQRSKWAQEEAVPEDVSAARAGLGRAASVFVQFGLWVAVR
jgi:hypothetical protein